MNFYSFANRFVILLVVLVLLLPGVVMAQDEPAPTDEPTAAETVTFETNTPQVVATEVEPTEAPATEEATPIPAVTDIPVTPVPDEPPVDEPDNGTPGVSENALIAVVQTLVWGIIALVAAIVIIFIGHGLLQGKSVTELARSQPVQWGITAAANVAAITEDLEDDAWIAARAKQLGWEVTNLDGVITLKKVEIPPISLPVG